MSIPSSLTIAQLNPDGSVPVPTAHDAAANAAAEALQREAQLEALKAKVDDLKEILAKPLNDILAEHDKFKEMAAAWDYRHQGIVCFASQDAVLFNGGVPAHDAAAYAHHMLDMRKAHDHAILDLGIPFDEAGVSDMGVFDAHPLLQQAVPAYGDIAYELDLS